LKVTMFYMEKHFLTIRHKGPKIVRIILTILAIGIIVLVTFFVALLYQFYHHEVYPLCSAPSQDISQSTSTITQNPLVEYYIHGRLGIQCPMMYLLLALRFI
jgi:hypothetical protein